MKNFLNLNFASLPRIYKLFLVIKIERFRKFPGLLNWFLNKLNFKIEMRNVMKMFVYLVFMIHFMACLWTLSSTLDLGSSDNWLSTDDAGMRDAVEGEIYLSALYWAITTCATVGYGDIIPTNQFEMILADCIILVGVAFFSFILSDLANNFS